MTSFDGTTIRAHWFPVSTEGGHRAPTVLMGPGWSLSGDTDTTGPPSGPGLLGSIPIKDLRDAGYNVLTWDPRGFGRSGGRAEVDSPRYEGRDVSTLIDWVAAQPGVQLDAPGNPRMGMVGGSYGGGIQLVAAGMVCRIDAIVPTVTWHSLVTSLDKAGTVKSGWSSLLAHLASSDRVDPEVQEAQASGERTGSITRAQRAWFAERDPGPLLEHVDVPTLFVQGTVDTLFTLQEAVDNYGILRRRGVPTSMLWFCGGHGVCLTPPGNQDLPERATISWLNRYVKRDTSVATGPRFTFVDQNGTTYSSDTYPVPTNPITATGQGELQMVATGGSGPMHGLVAGQALASVVGPIVPAMATNAVNVGVSFKNRPGVVVGAPVLDLTYRGTSPDGVRPTRIFAQLVDSSTKLVLGNQITPIDVTLDGRTHTTSVPLEIVAFTATTRSHLELQLVATTVTYAHPRLGGSIELTHVRLSIPVAAELVPR